MTIEQVSYYQLHGHIIDGWNNQAMVMLITEKNVKLMNAN